MKKIVFAMLALATVGFSALPPMAQSIRELQKLLSSPEIYINSAEWIKEISRNEKGYLVTTANYEMQVDIHYGGGPQGFCGPAVFRFEFQEPIDLRTGEPLSLEYSLDSER